MSSALQERVVEGRAVFHFPEEDAELAAPLCHVHGRQMQLTQPLSQVGPGKRPCLRCARMLLSQTAP